MVDYSNAPEGYAELESTQNLSHGCDFFTRHKEEGVIVRTWCIHPGNRLQYPNNCIRRLCPLRRFT